jgi:phage gp45-like
MSTLSVIQRELDKLRRLLFGLVRRGEITAIDGELRTQFSGYAGEQYDEVEPLQQWGFASRPPVGSEVLAVHLGHSEEAIIVASGNRADRPTDLAADEAVTYGKKTGSGQAQVRHKPDGTLALGAATGKFVEVAGATDAQVRGSNFIQAFQQFISDTQTAINTAVAVPPIDPAFAGFLTNMTTAIAALVNANGSAPWLSTKAKVG